MGQSALRMQADCSRIISYILTSCDINAQCLESSLYTCDSDDR